MYTYADKLALPGTLGITYLRRDAAAATACLTLPHLTLTPRPLPPPELHLRKRPGSVTDTALAVVVTLPGLLVYAPWKRPFAK